MDSLKSQTSLDSTSSEDFDDICIDHLDITVPPRKPHFLDYDAIPPPGFEEPTTIEDSSSKMLSSNTTTNGCSGESVKVDKKYERDGEISDYELAASGITKKDIFPQRKLSHNNEKSTGARKKKHFLDENPIPPDYMMEKEREYRSLDRNFDRQGEYDSLRFGRKHSLDREGRSRKLKEPSYTLYRFIEDDSSPTCHGTWPVDRPIENSVNYASLPPESMSNLGPKVECVYSLLSMLGSQDPVEMSKKFLELSRTPETCATLRQSGCIPLLVQMMHSDSDAGARKRAASALHNIVHCQPDDKTGRREAKVLRLIEQIMDYCSFLKSLLVSGGEAIADDPDRHPLAAVSSLMKVSFDEEHRHAMCQLGALQAIASLVHLDHAAHGPKPEDQCCNSLRRYALMALTNLTFGDGNNKALLCANKEFMEALVAQLDSAPNDLLQVTGSVLRNLSWRADSNMKAVLNEIGTVTALVKAAMKNKNENTLKSILSALWNLSAHCSTNKAEFCAVDGALAFLVDMLTYEGPSKTLTIIENAGGILRNVSSRIAVREDYRKVLRQRNCLGILLQQLKSESLTVVSNACGILWNLSARFPEDQKYLWDNGAIPMLRSLIHSKHRMISEGSSAALKNLLNFRPGLLNQNPIDPITKSMGLKELPTLNARKQRTLEQELNQNLAETCDNLDAITPPKEKKDFPTTELGKHSNATRLTRSAIVSKSESRDSIVSAKSDSVYEKYRRGHSAPPDHGDLTKDVKSHSFNLRNNYAVPAGFEGDQENELPIDYSVKYNSEVGSGNAQPIAETVAHLKPQRKAEPRNFTTYQETDLDQPTDFSLLYAENQAESDSDGKESNNPASNEIILILEDTVKCYETEGTPYAISNAASVSDLRNPKLEEQPPAPVPKHRTPQKVEAPVAIIAYGSGTYTPEKPINYCEEGTPGYFSRYESLSSLDESPQNFTTLVAKTKPEVVEEETIPDGISGNSPIPNEMTDTTKVEPSKPNPIASVSSSGSTVPVMPGAASIVATKPVAVPSSLMTPAVNSAQETPLMFSRRSSMDSLASVEPNTADDKSSVVSDFSRLASGIISPSELPDSPTQSMPQSPRRNSNVNPPYSSIQQQGQQPSAQRPIAQQRLRSVFEDDVNTFRVENTPAQFSCATSLSNLSLDDEPKITTDSLAKELMDAQSDRSVLTEIQSGTVALESCVLTDGEEEVNDNMLLATCINIGMNRGASSSSNFAQSNLSENQSSPSKKNNVKGTTNSEDAVRQYFTEDTPALLSKVGSNSNLSIISINTNKCDNVNLSDESSSVSDGGNDLLEQCIREGMQKSSSKQRICSPEAKDPIAMLRCGGLPPYLPVGDEMNKFVVEDSPCTFSVISGLSGLTVGSGVVGPANIKRLVDKPAHQLQCEKERQFAEDSLSSISIESEDDNNLLSQAIAAGCNKAKPQDTQSSSNMPYNRSMRKLEQGFQHMHLGNFNDGNDSLSSIDSSDSNDNQAKSLFEQCIRTGMNKQKKIEKQIPKQVVSPKRSQLPTLNFANKTPMQIDRDRHRERERKDEQLLKECINTGMAPKGGRLDSQIKPPIRHVRSVLAPTDFNQRLVTGGPATSTIITQTQNQSVLPKNGETTSVAVLEQQQQLDHTTSHGAPNIAPGVGMRESPDGTSNGPKNRPTHRDQLQIGNLQNTIGSELRMSYGSLNLSDSNGLLEQSNEYPALKLSNIDYGEDSVNESSFEMEISNEFLIEKDDDDCDVSSSTAQAIHDKHKDPDLMLKSVERLTHELVSTAEYLRTNASNNSEMDSHDYDSNNTVYEKKSASNSNNTWNEDTCPNDISFPSVSITAPMIASLNDDETSMSDINASSNQQFAEITPTNEDTTFMTTHHKDYNSSNFLCDDLFDFPGPNSQPNSLETETDTLVNDELDGSTHSLENKNDSSTGSGIRFQVGGEVQPQLSITIPQYVSSGPMSFESCSTMSSSTIIAMEANKLAHQFMQNLAESTTSLDLDNIRPPSGMDCISLSGYYDGTPLSPQLSRFRKKSLPPGLMAKRALSGGGSQQPPSILSGSVESVNSTYNLLDNIKPPSLMDELLDSMISVASITSEIVDNSLGTAQSNYETAFSDVDENTTTLQSCMDALLPMDYDSNGTPIPSDFSSAESTPRKNRGNNNSTMNGGVKRTLTPKQKRRIVKDRYKTYTIAADFVLKESFIGESQSQTDVESDDDEEDDEILKIEINHEPCNEDGKSVEQNMHADETINNNVVTSVKRRSLDPDRYKTRTIVYNGDFDIRSSVDPVTYNIDQLSTDDTEEMSSIRAMTKQFKFITEPEAPSDKKNNIFRMKLLDEEAHRTESDFNSIDFDQNSETESCDQNLNRTDDETSPKRCNVARIIKPQQTANYAEDSDTIESNATVIQETESKTIRGRKKPAYVSPYRKSAVSGSSSRTSSPKSQIGSTVVRANLSSRPGPEMKKTLAAKNVPKNQMIVSKTHVLVNRAGITNKTNANRSGLAKPGFINGAVRKNVAEKNLLNKRFSVEPKVKTGAKLEVKEPKIETTPLERQGTFVKDEPSIAQVPIVTSLPPSPGKTSKLPTKTVSPKISNIPKSPAKVGTFASKIKTVQKSASTDSASKVSPKALVSITPRPRIISSASDLNKRKALVGVRKSPSVPIVPQRSNSNASIRTTPKVAILPNTNPPSRSNSNLTTPRPVISRIAGIWKKSDEPKKTTSSIKSTGKPPIAAVMTKLIRSSTFDNSPSAKQAANNVPSSQTKSQKSAPTPGIATRKKEGALLVTPTSVVRRNKAETATSAETPTELSTKRVSRLGTFINIEGDCQVAG